MQLFITFVFVSVATVIMYLTPPPLIPFIFVFFRQVVYSLLCLSMTSEELQTLFSVVQAKRSERFTSTRPVVSNLLNLKYFYARGDYALNVIIITIIIIIAQWNDITTTN